jgi:Lar family restriction alleviation protein
MEAELKPCPFCGGKPKIALTDPPRPHWYVMCRTCKARVGGNSERKARHNWNRRTQPTDSGWIRVEERLPEVVVQNGECNMVLVYDRIPAECTGPMHVANTAWVNKHPEHISHWMPLPEPPDSEAQPTDSVCEWRLEDDERDIWETSCGQLWQFTCDGPREHGMEFCPFAGCGRRITIKESE